MLRGARLVVVDPRRTELAGLADVHLQARPGSNVAVFNGLARLLIEEGWADHDFLADARRRPATRSGRSSPTTPPSAVEQISGVPAERAARGGARCYGTADAHRRSSTDSGSPSTHTAPTAYAPWPTWRSSGARWAPTRGGGVNPLRGQNNVQGASDMGALPDLLPGYQQVTDADGTPPVGAVWGVEPPRGPGCGFPICSTPPSTGGCARST